ncbi:hypothetical protein DFH09DRAFT_1082020 [Mycena vulgaris]|nr:hypothetical protein DFH09DRAFT_1082020 [Mycena vulgaris]
MAATAMELAIKHLGSRVVFMPAHIPANFSQLEMSPHLRRADSYNSLFGLFRHVNWAFQSRYISRRRIRCRARGPELCDDAEEEHPSKQQRIQLAVTTTRASLWSERKLPFNIVYSICGCPTKAQPARNREEASLIEMFPRLATEVWLFLDLPRQNIRRRIKQSPNPVPPVAIYS